MNFAEPKTNLLQIGVHEGMRIADIGCGSGHYSIPAAIAVGDSGKVYAIDVQEDLLTHLKNTARGRHIFNIETIWGDVEAPMGTKLREHSVDAAIVSNILFQLPDRPSAVMEIKRILKPGGKVLVVDWAGSYGGIGPVSHMVFPEGKAEELFISIGFHKAKSVRAGPHHYGIIFTAP